MAINIKDDVAIAELRRLSELTGRSMARELATSVHERLARVEAADGARLARLLELARSSAALWPEGMRKGDPSAALYDDRGLPS